MNNNDDLEKLVLEKKFSIKDTGLSYRVINNWSEKGIINHLRDKKGNWHKFSVLELVEIHLYKELKKIGFSIIKIKNVKEKLYEGIFANKEVVEFICNGIVVPINVLFMAFVSFAIGEKIHLITSSDGKNIDLICDTDIAKNLLNNSLFGKSFFGDSCVIISLNELFEKNEVCNNPKDKKKLSALFEELLKERFTNNERLNIELGERSGVINKIRKTIHRKIEKRESLNKLSRKPNQKITLHSNNHGDLTAQIDEEL